nr:response regulator [Methylobacterium sp. yr668]
MAIVDDDSAVLSALSSLVRSIGYVALTFSSAEAFLAHPDLSNVTVLISDIQMPGGISGFELQEGLRSRHLSIPTVLMTGLSDEAIRERARESGAWKFMQKPVDSDALIECLEMA